MNNTDFAPFQGVHTALITPFNAFGDLDLDAFRQLILLQKEAKVHGLVTAGSTGESSTLNFDERICLIKEAKLLAKKDQVVIAGTGCNNTKEAIRLHKAAFDAGADASLSVVPYYNKASEEGLFAHFSAISSSADLPLILYNVPSRTGIDMPPHLIIKLIKTHENIIGIKEANPNMERLGSLVYGLKNARKDAIILAGDDASFLPFMAFGADGIISVSSNLVAEEMLDIYKHISLSNLLEARKISLKIHGLSQLLFSHTSPIPLKTIMANLGLIKKYFRLPLCALNENEEIELLKKLSYFSDLSFLKSHKAKMDKFV